MLTAETKAREAGLGDNQEAKSKEPPASVGCKCINS